MIYYHNFLSVTSPNTMDGSPARWIALIHRLHVAGEEGGTATMVVVFLPVLVCCDWLPSHLFELVVCRKMVQNGHPSVINTVTFGPTYACTMPALVVAPYHMEQRRDSSWSDLFGDAGISTVFRGGGFSCG